MLTRTKTATLEKRLAIPQQCGKKELSYALEKLGHQCKHIHHSVNTTLVVLIPSAEADTPFPRCEVTSGFPDAFPATADRSHKNDHYVQIWTKRQY